MLYVERTKSEKTSKNLMLEVGNFFTTYVIVLFFSSPELSMKISNFSKLSIQFP